MTFKTPSLNRIGIALRYAPFYESNQMFSSGSDDQSGICLRTSAMIIFHRYIDVAEHELSGPIYISARRSVAPSLQSDSTSRLPRFSANGQNFKTFSKRERNGKDPSRASTKEMTVELDKVLAV